MYYGARYYDPTTGTFITADAVTPGAGALSLNRYAYVNDNPTTLNDPTGRYADGKSQAAWDHCSANDSCNDEFVEGDGDGAARRHDEECIVSSACGGQQLVDAIANDRSGLGGLVFNIIDAAKQGDLGAADENWSEDDIDAVIAGGHLQRLLEQALGASDPRLIAMLQSVGRRLKPQHAAWERIDHESSLFEDVAGAVGSFVADHWRLATALAAVLTCAGQPELCAGALILAFGARSAGTIVTHGVSVDSALTIGLDGVVTTTAIMTGGMSLEALGPQTIGPVSVAAAGPMMTAFVSVLPATGVAASVLMPGYVTR